jgi:hypothetical protein
LLHPHTQSCRQKHPLPVWTQKENRRWKKWGCWRCKEALAALAEELEIEDSTELGEEIGEDVEEGFEVDEDIDDDDDDGLGDERDGMSKEDLAELEDSFVPIRLMLTKVSCAKNQFCNCLLIVLQLTSFAHWLSRSRIHPP